MKLLAVLSIAVFMVSCQPLPAIAQPVSYRESREIKALPGIPVNFERLADAIYKAEGGAKTSHPYGIMAHYRHTSPRQACLNTLKHQYAVYLRLKARRATFKMTFLRHLQGVYAPLGASNDKMGLNANWLSNVEYFYGRDAKNL